MVSGWKHIGMEMMDDTLYTDCALWLLLNSSNDALNQEKSPSPVSSALRHHNFVLLFCE